MFNVITNIIGVKSTVNLIYLFLYLVFVLCRAHSGACVIWLTLTQRGKLSVGKVFLSTFYLAQVLGLDPGGHNMKPNHVFPANTLRVKTPSAYSYCLSILFYWSIVDLQCCVSFWYTAKWFSYMCVCVCVCMCVYKYFFIFFSIMVYYRYWI